MLTSKEVLNIFRERKAYLEGHFELSSGLHSGGYLQAALVLQYPSDATKLCRSLAYLFEGLEVEVVISPAIGGIVVGQKVAEALEARAIFAEREKGYFTLRRGFRVDPDEKTLVVEDVMTTGGSVKEIVRLVELSGGKVAGVGCLIDRSGGKIFFDLKRKSKEELVQRRIYPKSLVSLEIETYPKTECPFCKEGVPLMKPGSRVRER
jgi:orotate phosphoribosyltransferase